MRCGRSTHSLHVTAVDTRLTTHNDNDELILNYCPGSRLHCYSSARHLHHLKMPPRKPPHRHRPITAATVSGALALALPALALLHVYINAGSLVPSVYTCIASVFTVLLFGYDKMQARNLEWRVRETTLHACAVLGGWPGALLGMHYFQHKTRKTRFLVVFWGIVVAWQGFWWVVWRTEYA